MIKKFTKPQQVKIARHYIFTNGTSYAKTAAAFNASVSQVRTYVHNFKRNSSLHDEEKVQKEAFNAERDEVIKEITEKGVNALVNETIADVIAEIRSSDSMKAKEKLDNLNRLTITMKRNQENHFMELIKQPDAEGVIELVQYYKPDLTPKQIIETWKKLKAQKG